MEQDLSILWGQCRQLLHDNLTASAYQTWFAPLTPIEWKDDTLVLAAKSQFVVDYIEENYLPLLSSALRHIFGEKVQLEYRVSLAGSSIDVPSESRSVEVASHPSQDRSGLGNTLAGNWESQLNPQYLFSNFIKGEPNKLARAAAVEIAKKPGKTIFNPLFLYGGSGVGKTHLACAIGNQIVETNPSFRVLYVQANTFKLQFQDAFAHNRIPDFLIFYQSVDVLIVDDIQYFAELKGTQDTFFQIFNYLQQSHKQLILTSDRSPLELRGVQDRLLSRFKWGLSAEITAPDYTLRRDILLFRMHRDGIHLSDDILDFIATNVHDNIRDLEGVLASLMAYSTLTDSPVDMALTQKVVGRLVSLRPRAYNPQDVLTSVSLHTNISERTILARTRQHDAVRARNIVIYLLKKYTDCSLSEIGATVHRDHATVAHSLESISNWMEYDAVLRQEIAAIENQLTH